MKKQILFAFVFLSFVACSKPNRKDPMAPANPATDSAREADSKKAAQKDAQKEGSDVNGSGTTEGNGAEKENPNPQPDVTGPASPDSNSGTNTPVNPNSNGNSSDGNTSPSPAPAGNANGTPENGSTDSSKPATPNTTQNDSNNSPKPNSDVATKPNEPVKPDSPAETPKEDKAENNSEKPVETAEEKPEDKTQGKTEESNGDKPASPGATAGFPFKESYMGDALTLVHPSQNQKNWGEVRISGADAQKLFQTLKLRRLHVDGNDVWLEGKKKHGYHISCYEQASKEKPNQPEYDCALFLEFKTGTLVPKVSKILKDESVPELKETYNGQMVKLIAPDTKKWGWIQLKGQDAKALYSTLAVEENSQPHSNPEYQPLKQKIGRNVVCYEHTLIKNPGSPSYACSFHILYTNGLARPFAETVEPKKTWVQSLKEKIGFQ